MGAWGTNFFESEWDLDLASDFYGPAGLAALEEKAKERTQSAESNATTADRTAGANEEEDNDDEDLYRLSVHAAQCADVELVREHLDAGALRKLIDEWKVKMVPTDESDNMAAFHKDYYSYQFILLGACAMTLGCKLPEDFRQLLICKCRTSKFKRDAQYSMKLALGDGPEGYKDGVPFDFAKYSKDSDEDED